MEMKDFEDLPEILRPLAVAYTQAQTETEKEHAWLAWAAACDMLLEQELNAPSLYAEGAEYMTAEENAVWQRWEDIKYDRLLTDEQRAVMDDATVQLKPALEMLASKGTTRH